MSNPPSIRRGTTGTLPRISIVVPSFNQARFLPTCIESLLRQDYGNLEIIVIDGGSTDDSVAVIRRYEKHLKSWVSEKDDGQSDAINKGFGRATGELYGWVNSDDFLLDEALHRVSRAYAERPQLGLITGNGLRVDELGNTLAPFIPGSLRIDVTALRLGVDYLLQPSTFFSRAAWTWVGGLKRDLNWCMDWDLWIRILDRFEGISLPHHLGASREYGDTKTSSGGFERWNELRRMIAQHTGTAITPGIVAYLADTLTKHLGQDPKARELMPGLHFASQQFFEHAFVPLIMLTGRPDGFPTYETPAPIAPPGPIDGRPTFDSNLETQRGERRKRTGQLISQLKITNSAEAVNADELQAHLEELEQGATRLEDDRSRLEQQLNEALRSNFELSARIERIHKSLFGRTGRLLRLI